MALDVRRSDDRVTVAANETIDDTLIAFGDRVEIDGTVTGLVVPWLVPPLRGAPLTGACGRRTI